MANDYLLDVVLTVKFPIIEKLDEKIKAKYPQENVAIIDKNNCSHGTWDIHYGFSINGVASAYREILKQASRKLSMIFDPEKLTTKLTVSHSAAINALQSSADRLYYL